MLSSSNNVLKSSFIQFTGENTRVIDSSALVAKRLEGFSGVLRERSDSLEDMKEETEEGYDAVSELVSEEPAPIEEELPTPEDLLNEAEERCNEMLEQAKAEAERIIDEAKQSAENLKSTAKLEGYAEGKESAEAELADARASLDEERNEMLLQYEELVRNIEPQMVEIITNAYEKVFGENFFSRRDVMVCLINRALMHVDNKEQVTINVCPSDYDMLIGMKSSLYEKVSLQLEPNIIQRDDYEKGQAKIETEFGIIDCSVDTELKELSRVLKLLSYEGNSNSWT